MAAYEEIHRASHFAPSSGRFVSVSDSDASCVELPHLANGFRIDHAAREAATGDFGRIIAKSPHAVCRPATVEELRSIVVFARDHSIPLAARGSAHTFYGQSQVGGGISVSLGELSNVSPPHNDSVVVQCGAKWRELVNVLAKHELMPPIITDNLDVTIGGTLSQGGFGGSVCRVGPQVEQVLELEVVTGTGELITCSRSSNRDLFDAVLCGQGTCGFMVSARMKAVPLKRRVRAFILTYPGGLDECIADLLKLADDDRFSYVLAMTRGEMQGPAPFIEAAVFYNGDSALINKDDLLRGLKFDREAHIGNPHTDTDVAMSEWSFRYERAIPMLKALGGWDGPHATFDVFVPSSRVVEAVRLVDEDTSARGLPGFAPMLMPFRRELLSRPLLPLPDEPVVFLMNVLRFAAPGDVATTAAQLEANKACYERIVKLGGTRHIYPAIPFSAEQWERHFGDAWEPFASAKRKYDPAGILGTGSKIFA